MTRTEKENLVNELTEQLKESNFVYITDTGNLNAKDTNDLRRMLFQSGVKMRIAKNTLIELAMEKSGKEFGALKGTLKGTSAIMFSENMKAPAIAIQKFRGKKAVPALKGAYIDSDIFLGDDQLDALAKLKSKEDLIGEVIGLLQSPVRNVIGALQSGGHKLSGILKTLEERN